MEWSQERWSGERDGEFKYVTYIHHIDKEQEDNVIKPNTNWETKTMLLNAEQEDELREGTDQKYVVPNWYVDYNEPYKHYVDYNEPYKYNV